MNVRRVLFGLAAASLFLAPVFAPSLAQAADVKVLDIGKGQQVWFSEDHTLPMIAITASIPAGRPMIRRVKKGWPHSPPRFWMRARARWMPMRFRPR